MNPAGLVGRTVHVARGTRYEGAYDVDAVTPHETEPGWFHLRQGRLQSPAYSVEDHAGQLFATEAEARAAARSRRAEAKARRAAAGPAMMPATDGNYLAMLVGATRVSRR